MSKLKYEIIESPNYTSRSKVGINTFPENEPLMFFLSGLRKDLFPYYLSELLMSRSFGVENSWFIFYDEMDWEDKANFKSDFNRDIEKDEIRIDFYDGKRKFSVINKQDFINILYDYSLKLLDIYGNDNSLGAEWREGMKQALSKLLEKTNKEELTQAKTDFNKTFEISNVIFEFNGTFDKSAIERINAFITNLDVDIIGLSRIKNVYYSSTCIFEIAQLLCRYEIDEFEFVLSSNSNEIIVFAKLCSDIDITKDIDFLNETYKHDKSVIKKLRNSIGNNFNKNDISFDKKLINLVELFTLHNGIPEINFKKLDNKLYYFLQVNFI